MVRVGGLRLGQLAGRVVDAEDQGVVADGCGDAADDLLDYDNQQEERECVEAARLGFERAGGREGSARVWDDWHAARD